MTRSNVLSVLARYIGKENGIKVERLAHEAGCTPRQARALVTELREEGVPVCAHPSTGYFMAANDAELQRYFIAFLESRAMRSLHLIARVKRISLPDLLGQLRLPT